MTTKGTKRQNSICLLEKDGDYNQKQRCRELIMEINKAREKEYVDFTLDYYDVNAESFCFGTQNAAFSNIRILSSVIFRRRPVFWILDVAPDGIAERFYIRDMMWKRWMGRKNCAGWPLNALVRK